MQKPTYASDIFLKTWRQFGIDKADIALRRPSGAWWQSLNHDLDHIPLSLARAANCQRSDIFIRPARGLPWPYLFLDDLALPVAYRLIAAHAGIAVHTSPAGGCQAWIALTVPIQEHQRTIFQRILAAQLHADPASISGDHYGRLPGLRNWKRLGVWVTLRASNLRASALDPASLIEQASGGQTPPAIRTSQSTVPGHDISDSAREWGWVCGALEHGLPIEQVRQQLLLRARLRRGADAERYVELTLRNALAGRVKPAF
jgi:hypothetical protein